MNRKGLKRLLQLSYDWFQVTWVGIERSDELSWVESLVSVVESFGYSGVDVRLSPKGRNGYLSVRDVFWNDEKILSFSFNAARDNQPMQMTATGSWAGLGKEIADYARKEWRVGYYVTRVDVACDFIGDFERVYRYLSKNRGSIKSKLVGDWENKKDGRTYYLGSNQGRAQIRFYEKGIEQMRKNVDSRRDWLRLELQYKPEKRERDDTCFLDLDGFLGRVKWAYKLFRGVSGFGYENFSSIDRKRSSDVDLSLLAMAKQYGRIMSAIADREGGYDLLGLYLGELIEKGSSALRGVSLVREGEGGER